MFLCGGPRLKIRQLAKDATAAGGESLTSFHRERLMIRFGAMLVAFAAVCLLNASAANAHNVFKKAMKEKYGVADVSCNVCHGKDKKIRNDLGKLFEKELAGKDLTKKFNDLKDKPEERKAFEKEMEEIFKKSLEVVEAKEGPGGKTYAELFKSGGIEGIKK